MGVLDSSRTWRLAVLMAIVVSGAALRLYRLDLDPAWTIYTDLTDEGWWAGNAAHRHLFGTWLIPDNYNTVFVSPVATAIFALAFTLLGVSLHAARTATALVGAACGPLLYWAFRGRLATRPLLVAVALLSGSFFPVALCRMALLDLPACAFSLLTVGFYLRFLDERSKTTWIALFASFLLALLTKANSIVLAAVLFLHLAAYGLGRRTGLWSRGVVALLVPVACFAAIHAVLRHVHPDDWRTAFGVNVADKIPSFGAWLSSLLWFLAFNQLLENSPILVIAAWTGLGAWLARLARSGVRTVAEEPVAALASLWLLGSAAFVASFPYQPKRYHFLEFVPMVLQSALLFDRLERGDCTRRELLAGGLVSGAVLCFAFGMTWIRARGEFVPGIPLDPANTVQLLWLAGGAFCCLVAVPAAAALWSGGCGSQPVRLAHVAIVMVALQLAIDATTYRRWLRGTSTSVQAAARDVGRTMRDRWRGREGELLLAGASAHTVMVEAHLPGRRIVIEPAAGVFSIPAERITHLLVDDPVDLAIYRKFVPQLAAGFDLVGSWKLCPDWETPVRWQLYELRPGQVEQRDR